MGVQVFCLEHNRGQAAARNLGLRLAAQAHFEYIIFLDADDRVSPGYVSEMYKRARETNADVVVANFISVINGRADPLNGRPTPLDDFDQTTSANFLHFLLRDRSTVSPCNKLIRIETCCGFVPGVKEEDTLWIFSMMSQPRELHIFRSYNASYFYIIRESSSTKVSDLRVFDGFYILDCILDLVRNRDPNLVRDYSMHWISSVCAYRYSRQRFAIRMLFFPIIFKKVVSHNLPWYFVLRTLVKAMASKN